MFRAFRADDTVVHCGDSLVNWRGDTGVFEGITRVGTEAPSKVQIDGRECFARAWNLTVKSVG